MLYFDESDKYALWLVSSCKVVLKNAFIEVLTKDLIKSGLVPALHTEQV